jgi:Tetratricopeptide repeat.
MERWERKQLRDEDVIREELHYWLGRYYESAGRLDEAKEAYQQALEAGEQFDVTEGRTYRERSKGRLAEIENS